MELNIEVCRTIAVQYGLPLQYVIKEFHVFDVLGQVAAYSGRLIQDTDGRIVFKGGTALNKVYLGGMQRFSEDLDFDFEAEGDKGGMIISALRDRCKDLAGNITGYDVSEFRRVKDTIQFYCNYTSPLGGLKDHVRVDASAKRILSEKPLEIRPAVSFFTKQTVSGFRAYSLEDLVARKLHALNTRSEGKDVYDVSNALSLCGISELPGAIRKMLESEKSGETPRDFLQKTIMNVRNADAKKLRNLSNPFIPLSSRPKDWLELRNDLALRLESLLSGS